MRRRISTTRSAPGKPLVEEIPGSDAVCIGGHNRWDVPRNSQNVALLGDPRNDENLIVSQLQLAFLRFHNRVLDDVTEEFGSGYTRDEIFREAQRRVRWHYQWIVLHEFLPKTVGKSLVRAILDDGPKYYKWRNDPFIPVEFSVGAYRFGHSQVRPSYRANFGHERHGRGAAVLRPVQRSRADRGRGPGRSARRVPRPAPLHRLADVLRLR